MAPLYNRYVPQKAGSGWTQSHDTTKSRLYKRYIPPTSAFNTNPNNVEPAATVEAAIQSSAWRKRKHERSEGEKAERKEKKARKKGGHASLPAVVSNVSTIVSASEPAKTLLSNGGSASTADSESTAKVSEGEFAHIKSVKKRHKLEKEARRARQALAKTASHDDSEPGFVMRKADITEDVKAVKANGLENEARLLKAQDDGPEAENPRMRKEEAGDRVIAATDHETQGPKESMYCTSRDHAVDAVEATEAARSTAVNLPEATVVSQPRKRRHKLEAILQQPEETGLALGAEDDEHLRKHGGILTKFQKSTKLAQSSQQLPKDPRPETMVHEERLSRIDEGLTPLPQPAKALTPDFVPDALALPLWLRSPTLISSVKRKDFAELGLEAGAVSQLASLGFDNALPVQQVLIPLLTPPGQSGASYLPGTDTVLPDLARYNVREGLGKLRALIVVPTRELVQQVAAVAESLAKGSNVKVGTATGGGGRSLADEAAKLIQRGRLYDPERYKALIVKVHRRNCPPSEDDEDFEDFVAELEEQDSVSERLLQDTVECLIDHVPTYSSAVDVLVVTPGRLLEHVSSTLGFSLAHVQYLVLDEADKLMEQQYDGFLEKLNAELERPLKHEEQDAREGFLRSKGPWDEQKERRVRKIVLSATMTRDVGLLAGLHLRRPRMVVVQGAEQGSLVVPGADVEDAGVKIVANGFELPPTLNEFCVPVGDGNEKPMQLLVLLRKIMLAGQPGAIKAVQAERGEGSHAKRCKSESDVSDSVLDSSSDIGSEIGSEISSDSSNSAPDSEEEVSGSLSDRGEAGFTPDRYTSAIHADLNRRSTTTKSHRPSQVAAPPTVLIFTSSTESANRLSHLIGTLEPQLASHILTLTKSKSAAHAARHSPKKPMIAISTDRASRGLDALAGRSITHVVQYDVPRSLTGYVHRVGRTARAGRAGEAWTLYTDREARWFVTEIVKTDCVKRAKGVEKIKLSAAGEDERRRYGEVIEGMREKVFVAPR